MIQGARGARTGNEIRVPLPLSKPDAVKVLADGTPIKLLRANVGHQATQLLSSARDLGFTDRATESVIAVKCPPWRHSIRAPGRHVNCHLGQKINLSRRPAGGFKTPGSKEPGGTKGPFRR
jgi:hypothetical protein